METPLRSEQGSAGIMFNLTEHPQSIRAQAKKLLHEAVAAAAGPDLAPCTANCAPVRGPAVVFRVAPMAYLPLPQQSPLCTQLATTTSTRPLTYPVHEFSTVDELDAWIMQFSQGQGTDGKLLYQQCGGNCDPSYTFVIDTGSRGYAINTEVYCGFARDRKNNLYSMTTALRAGCAVPLR